MRLFYPIEGGYVTNWEDMSELWSYVYKKLGVDPSSQPVLLTDKPLNPRASRERTLEVALNDVGAEKVAICNNAIMSLFAADRTTGVVLHSGSGVTHVVPVYEGYVLKHAIIRLDLSGTDVTDQLVNLFVIKAMLLARQTLKLLIN